MVSRIVKFIRRVIGTDKVYGALTKYTMETCSELHQQKKINEEKFDIMHDKVSLLREKIPYLEKKITSLEEKLSITHAYLPLKPNEKLRIVFLFQSSSLWRNWKSLWDACLQDTSIEAKLVLVEMTYADTKLHLLNEAKHFLIDNNIPFFMGNLFVIEHFRPHVVFVQTPYHDTLPDNYSLEIFRSLGCRVAYIPYGLEVGGGATNLKYQFNMPLHQQAWRIFTRSVRHQKMYSKYCSVGSAHTIVTGHPKLDLHQGHQPNIVDSSVINKIDNRRVILWCPHFSILKDQWSTFNTYVAPILEYFSLHHELFLIVRPHPLLFSRLRDQMNWSDDKISDFKKSINIMQNAYLDEGPDYGMAFELSDALLSDAGSFLLEYFSTGKPVAYLENQNGPGLNDDGDIIQYFYVVHHLDEMNHFFEMIYEKKDPKKIERCKAIPEYLHQTEKGAGLTIKEHLLSAIHQYDRPMVTNNTFKTQTKKAEDYWRKATTTYLAASDYYDKQEVAIAMVLKNIGNVCSILDVGCGDGRFTKLLSQNSQFTKAIDVSSHLIEQAKKKLTEDNIHFAVESITDSISCHRYDLVSCMGVTSGLIEDDVFLRTLDILIASCKPGGYLLMKDTLSITKEQNVASNEDNYIAVYRNIENYIRCIISRGCQLIEDYELFFDSNRGMINKLFLFSVPLLTNK